MIIVVFLFCLFKVLCTFLLRISSESNLKRIFSGLDYDKDTLQKVITLSEIFKMTPENIKKNFGTVKQMEEEIIQEIDELEVILRKKLKEQWNDCEVIRERLYFLFKREVDTGCESSDMMMKTKNVPEDRKKINQDVKEKYESYYKITIKVRRNVLKAIIGQITNKMNGVSKESEGIITDQSIIVDMFDHRLLEEELKDIADNSCKLSCASIK